jgi:tRNA pseudouridine13 synthase
VAIYRRLPEDFVVSEVAAYPPSGEGEHTFVLVEKRLRTTEDVATTLAERAGIPAREVGYAGRKDRHAVTRQWFSLQHCSPEALLDLELEGLKVLDAKRHTNKLRTGHLRGNRFEIRVREIDASQRDATEGRLRQVAADGFANRFGEQRFGRWGDNAARGAELLLPPGPPGGRGAERRGMRRNKREARFLISALQSAVFHRILELREAAVRGVGAEGLVLDRPGVDRLAVDRLDAPAVGRLWLGDVALVVASGGPFLVSDLAAEQPRADRWEIVPSALIFGNRVLRAQGEPGSWEREALAEWGLDPVPAAPRGIELRGARRALRVLPADLSWRFLPSDEQHDVPEHGAPDQGSPDQGNPDQESPETRGTVDLQLECTLPPGCYATVLLETIFGTETLRDASREGRGPGSPVQGIAAGVVGADEATPNGA